MPVEPVEVFIFNPDTIWLKVRPFHNTGFILADIENYIYFSNTKKVSLLRNQFLHTLVVDLECGFVIFLWDDSDYAFRLLSIQWFRASTLGLQCFP